MAYLEMPGPAAPKWKISPETHCLRGLESSRTVGPLQAPKGSLSLSPAPGVAVPKAWRTAFHFSTDLSLLSLQAFAGLPAQRQGTCTQLSFATRGRADWEPEKPERQFLIPQLRPKETGRPQVSPVTPLGLFCLLPSPISHLRDLTWGFKNWAKSQCGCPGRGPTNDLTQWFSKGKSREPGCEF